MPRRRLDGRAALIACAICPTLLCASSLPAQSKVSLGFRDSIPAWLVASHVPGAVVAVLENGKVASIQAFGQLRAGVPMTPRALFNVASLTKPIVAITTLKLASAHRLALDAPLDPYWIDPDIRNDPRHAKLTTRLVLSHQTGFPNWRRSMPRKKLGFLFDPGARLGYSGEGFEYLRHALEHKYGRSLQQLSDSILFRPLGMSETTYGWNPRREKSRFAIGHDSNGIAVHDGMRTTSRPSAADWLVTSVGDYARFARYVLNRAGLSGATYTAMTSPQAQFDGKPGEAMGLGWEVMTGPTSDPTILMHTGSDEGIKTMIILLPASQRGLVIFTNGERGMDVIVRILQSSLHLKELER